MAVRSCSAINLGPGCSGTMAAWTFKYIHTAVGTCVVSRDGHDPHAEIREVPDGEMVIKIIMYKLQLTPTAPIYAR